MALGRRTEKQTGLFIPTAELIRGPGQPFYRKLNAVLAQAGFDAFAENPCAPHYKESGRPGIAPSTYSRMLCIGYFEGIDSRRVRAAGKFCGDGETRPAENSSPPRRAS